MGYYIYYLYQPESTLLQDSYWESVKNNYVPGLSNIRRDHFDDLINSKILNLNQNQIISSEKLKERIKNSNIDFYVFAHLSNDLYKYGDILDYIKWAKEIGFKEVHFIGNSKDTKSNNYLYGIYIYFNLDFDDRSIIPKSLSKKDDDITIYFDLEEND